METNLYVVSRENYIDFTPKITYQFVGSHSITNVTSCIRIQRACRQNHNKKTLPNSIHKSGKVFTFIKYSKKHVLFITVLTAYVHWQALHRE